MSASPSLQSTSDSDAHHPLKNLTVARWPDIEVCLSDFCAARNDGMPYPLYGSIAVYDIPVYGIINEPGGQSQPKVELFFERVELELRFWQIGDSDSEPMLYTDFNGSFPGRIYSTSSMINFYVSEIVDHLSNPRLVYYFKAEIPSDQFTSSGPHIYSLIQMDARAWYWPDTHPRDALRDPPISIAGPYSTTKKAYIAPNSKSHVLRSPSLEVPEFELAVLPFEGRDVLR